MITHLRSIILRCYDFDAYLIRLYGIRIVPIGDLHTQILMDIFGIWNPLPNTIYVQVAMLNKHALFIRDIIPR